MELDNAIQTRRSIRKFSSEPVTDTMIDSLLEAARLAPSGSNIQPWRFVVVKSPQIKERLRSVTAYRFAVNAPVLFVCCADLTSLESRNKRVNELLEAGVFNDVEVDGISASTSAEMTKRQAINYLFMNVGIAITHMMLKAVDLGLGTCWIGGFDPIKTKEILELDDNLYVVALLPVGHHHDVPKQRPRLPMEKIIIKTV